MPKKQNPAGGNRQGSGSRVESSVATDSSSPFTTQAEKSPTKGGKRSRQKGDRFERAIVRLLQDRGIGAERTPLSGSLGGKYRGDITVPALGRDLIVEAKSRGAGFVKLYDWLQWRDALIVRADRKEALVVLPLKLAAEILIAAERGRGK